MGRGIRLVRIFGFDVRVDASWLVLGILVAWSLAVGYFPDLLPFLSDSTYVWMGVAGAIGLFVSIVFHELSHSLVARQYGIRMKGITLFIFGGVAEMEDEPPSPAAEFATAAAGPISSIVLAFALFGLDRLVVAVDGPVTWVGVLHYLAGMNVILAVFNLVPAFPLDGGRLLRAAMWSWRGDLLGATRFTSGLGSAFGMFLILLGVWEVLRGRFISGMWLFLIGLFLRNAASSSYQSLVMRQALEGWTVDRLMKADPIVIPPGVSLQVLADAFIYRFHYKAFPVVQGERVLGIVGTREMLDVPRNEWPRVAVGDRMEVLSAENSISPRTPALQALKKMNGSNRSRLLVVDGERLAGLLTFRDLVRFLSVHLGLREERMMLEPPLPGASPDSMLPPPPAPFATQVTEQPRQEATTTPSPAFDASRRDISSAPPLQPPVADFPRERFRVPPPR